jgi:glycosyltransferase involved in cell wall biosynthesis
MFEMIGDPVEAVRTAGIVSRTFGLTYGDWIARQVIRRAAVGSYVSHEHLQRRYPAGKNVLTSQISSIRLPGTQIRPPKVFQEAPLPLRLILVASFRPVKAHDVLVKGIAAARAKGADVHLTLVGDGPCRANVERLCRHLHISDIVTFVGHVGERERVFEALDASDLFVMCSSSEGMPRAMIEAMARGLPAIGSDAPGIAELLPPDQRFAIGSHDQLGSLIKRLSTAPGQMNEMAVRSHGVALRFEKETLGARRRELLLKLRATALASA